MKVNFLKTFDSLNGDITIEEIKQVAKKLENKNAPGNDNLTNRMIKCSDKPRYLICRWMVHQSCSVLQKLILNYYLVVFYH